MGVHIGLVGCGPWGGLILRDLLSLGVEVSVVARHESSVERAEALGATQVVRAIDQLPVVDGAVVATEATNHFDAIAALIDRAVPIYSEKPVTTSLDDARTLAERAPEQIFVMHKWRYHPAVEAIREMIQRGDLGEVRSIRTTRRQWGTAHADIDCIWTLLPHDLSIVLHLLGEIPEVTHAWGTNENGDLVSAGATLGNQPWVRLDVSTRAAERRRNISVEGATATAVLSDTDYGAITLRETDADETRVIRVATTMPLLAELTAFGEYLCGGSPPMSTLAEAVTVVERCTRIRELAGR